jgi:hypothetical protein
VKAIPEHRVAERGAFSPGGPLDPRRTPAIVSDLRARDLEAETKARGPLGDALAKGRDLFAPGAEATARGLSAGDIIAQATRVDRQALWLPMHLPGMNEIVAAAKGRGGRGFAYAKMKREIQENIVAFCNVAKLRPVARARLAFLWVEKDRRRDKDNIAAAKKFCIDSLVVAGVLPADGWSAVVGFTDDFAVEKRRHGVEITIIEAP